LITVRPANERLRTRIGWLDSRHTFSFEEHIDPRHMGFRALRVINEDIIAPSHGFGMQPRRDLEILTWVIAGALRHQDSLGTESIVKPGELQRLTAGTGLLHSEINASDTEPLHLLQVWITPERTRLPPGYERRTFSAGSRDSQGRLTLMGSRDGRQGSVTIHQDIAVYCAQLHAGDTVSHAMRAGRHGWVQVVRGTLELDNLLLHAGDGASISTAGSTTGDRPVRLRASTRTETLLFDLA
jgi:redox-sensitive bicupin YhaK (pirin superfamily)